MKARLLKKLLNNTGYTVHNTENIICIGSPLCSKLINVNKATLEVKYALDTFHEGRKSLKNEELIFIWDELHKLITNGELRDIIDGNDVIESPLPVFSCCEGILIETFTDNYGYPNVTIEGELMYDNTWFKTKQEAIKYGIKDIGIAIKAYDRMMKEREEELLKFRSSKERYTQLLENLQKIKQ